MLDFLNQVYELSQYLSLNSKDINKVLNRKSWTLRILFKIILLITFGMIAISIFLLVMRTGANIQDNTYATGTFYSTAKLKDIKNHNEIKYWLWKKIRSKLL